jgi:hypothetical protein
MQEMKRSSKGLTTEPATAALYVCYGLLVEENNLSSLAVLDKVVKRPKYIVHHGSDGAQQ